ncbi:hypothetical protein B481_0603 [Planococcus halocryophilus Or1]|uniref:hypothetical protein n=1 Tax=Planococcus halocryophilus TaxID=1215089 RepID=UPI0002B85899|nr:hypothetical protein [Planococcus halocryophilus]EMF47601.1 hypothetical protein B481_0603 [Planococcus halocryophilus Or1]
MDFKTRIIETVLATEIEVNKIIKEYEITIGNQKDVINRQEEKLQELKEKLKKSEEEKLQLQVHLDLEIQKINLLMKLQNL